MYRGCPVFSRFSVGKYDLVNVTTAPNRPFALEQIEKIREALWIGNGWISLLDEYVFDFDAK